jgi:hypothetical protein
MISKPVLRAMLFAARWYLCHPAEKKPAEVMALYFMHYNFVRIHQTLRVTPAMEAGIAGHVWGMEEIVALLP